MQLPHMFRRPIRPLFPSTFRSDGTEIQLPGEKSRSSVQGTVCSAELGQARHGSQAGPWFTIRLDSVHA